MTRIIDKHSVAVFYETVTGECQKRGSRSIDGDDTSDIDAFLALNPGLEAVIVPRTALPGLHAVVPPGGDSPVTANEHFFRHAVANHTGMPYFKYGADRAVMVHPAGHVVSAQLGNVPGLDNPHPGHTLISHQTAEVGDIFDGQRFLRNGQRIL